MHAKLLQSCPTLCNPMHCSPPGSSVHGILQAKLLEWVAMPFCSGFSPPRDWTHTSCLLQWQALSLPPGKPDGLSGNSTEMDFNFLLQGIFPTQGSNPGLPHCRQMLYHLSHQEVLKIPNNCINLKSKVIYRQFKQILSKTSHFIQFSRSVVSDSLRSHGMQHVRPPCPSPTPRV